VQAIGELDEDDADVPHHRQHHLAEVLRLGLGLRFEVDVGEFADTIDQLGDFLAEAFGHLFLGDAGILDDVVQDGRGDAVVIHVHLGQDAGHSDGMGDVGLTGEALLTVVRLGAEQIGLIDLADLVRLEIGFQNLAQVADAKFRTSLL